MFPVCNKGKTRCKQSRSAWQPADSRRAVGAVESKTLWALGNYSFFIRPGYIRIGLQGADNLDTLVASAYQAPDKSRVVAVFVNSSFEIIPIKMSLLQGGNEKVKKVSIYKTGERSDLANMCVPEIFSHDVEYIIPPRSLITIVFDF